MERARSGRHAAGRRLALAAALAVVAAAPAVVRAEVRVERLPDGTRVVRNLPAQRPAAAPVAVAAPRLAGVVPAVDRTVSARPLFPPRPATRRRLAPEELHPLVASHAAREGLDAELVEAVIGAESAGDPAALSAKGAMGLMQLMPATALDLAVADPWDAEDNVRGGVTYLRRMLDRFGDLDRALAAYNAGPGAVDRFGGVPPYPETRDYVRRVLALYRGEPLPAGGPAARKGPPPRLVRGADGRLTLTNTRGR